MYTVTEGIIQLHTIQMADFTPVNYVEMAREKSLREVSVDVPAGIKINVKLEFLDVPSGVERLKIQMRPSKTNKLAEDIYIN